MKWTINLGKCPVCDMRREGFAQAAEFLKRSAQEDLPGIEATHPGYSVVACKHCGTPLALADAVSVVERGVLTLLMLEVGVSNREGDA